MLSDRSMADLCTSLCYGAWLVFNSSDLKQGYGWDFKDWEEQVGTGINRACT